MTSKDVEDLDAGANLDEGTNQKVMAELERSGVPRGHQAPSSDLRRKRRHSERRRRGSEHSAGRASATVSVNSVTGCVMRSRTSRVEATTARAPVMLPLASLPANKFTDDRSWGIGKHPIPLRSYPVSVQSMTAPTPCYLVEWYHSAIAEEPLDDTAARLKDSAVLMSEQGSAVPAAQSPRRADRRSAVRRIHRRFSECSCGDVRSRRDSGAAGQHCHGGRSAARSVTDLFSSG